MDDAIGRVASLHVHPAEDTRYFGRKNRAGRPRRRQVTLIEREQIAQHAASLGMTTLEAGIVRANVETTGIDLQKVIRSQAQIGEAVLLIYEPRAPCGQMDRIAPGMRNLMKNGKQGVVAQVIQSGAVRVGDAIRAMPEDAEEGTRISRI
jgi:MOSC domain-containing protein YiiM